LGFFWSLLSDIGLFGGEAAGVKALLMAHCNLDTHHMLRGCGAELRSAEKSPTLRVKEP